jgi:hypothetical protein
MNIHYEKGLKNKKILQVEARIIKGKKIEKEESQREKNPSKGKRARREVWRIRF